MRLPVISYRDGMQYYLDGSYDTHVRSQDDDLRWITGTLRTSFTGLERHLNLTLYLPYTEPSKMPHYVEVKARDGT